MEFSQLLSALSINEVEILERFSGNSELLQRFICKFPMEKTYQEFSIAFQEGKKDEEERLAHTLKGITANLGFEKLKRYCSDFLNDLHGAQEHLSEEFACITSEHERLVNLIQAYSADTDNN